MSLITATLLPTTKQSPTSITPPQALKNYSEADETLSIMAFVRFLQKYQLFETQSTLLKELSLGDKSQITLEEFQQAIQKKHRISPITAPMENEENDTIKNAVIHTSQLSSEASSVQFQDVNNTSPAKIPQEITSLSSPVIKQEPHSSFLDTPTQTSNVSEIPLPLPTSTTCPTAGTVPPSFQIPICVNAFNSSQTNTSGQTVFTLLPSPQTLVSNGTHPTQFVLNAGTSVSGPQLQQLANGNLSAIIPATIQLSLPGQQPQQQQPQILTTLPAQHALQHLPQHHIMQSPVQQLQQQFSQAQIQQPVQIQQIVQHQTQIQSPSNHIIQPQQIQIVSPKEHVQQTQIYNPHQQQLHKQLDHTDQTKQQQQYSSSVMQFHAKQPILTTQIQPQFVEFPIQDQKLATTSVDNANLPTDIQQTSNITTTTISKSQDVAPASTTSNIIFSIQCLPQNSSQAATSEFIQTASLIQHPVMKSDIQLQQEGMSNLDNTPRKVIYSQIANPGALNQTAKTIFTTNGVDPIHYTSAPAEFSNILTAGLNPHYSFDPSFELTQRRRKKRAVFAPQVRRALEQAFESNSRPSRRELEYLAQKLGLLFEEVRVWFCNKRQKERQIQMQQTFSDPQNGSLSSIPNDADIGNESTPPLLDNNAFSQSSLLDLPEFTPDKMICTTDLLCSPIKDIVFANAVKDEFHISEQPIAMGVN